MESLPNIGNHWRFDVASKGGNIVTISELAREALEHFHRDNPRKVWALKDGAPEWVESLARDAHDGWPDDWTFEAVVDILGALNEGEFVDGDNAREADTEICDGLVDIGMFALLDWVRDDLGRLGAANEALEHGEADSVEQALMGSQMVHLGAVFESVVSSLESELEDREGE